MACRSRGTSREVMRYLGGDGLDYVLVNDSCI